MVVNIRKRYSEHYIFSVVWVEISMS